MHITDTLNFYEEVKDDIKSQSTSIIRTKIMISLSEGPKKTKDLRELTGIPASTLIHGINELEKQELVLKEKDKFFLSQMGKIMALKLVDTVRAYVSMKKLQKLLFNHQIKDIPQDLLMNIGDLSNSQLIETDNIDLFKTHGTHIEIVLDSKEIKGVSPIFYPNYAGIFKKLIEEEVKVELILTEDVLKKTIESVEEGKKDLEELILTRNLTLWILNDVKVAFTITNKSMVLGLFLINDMYDSSRLLVSDDKDSINWGNKLFEYYRKKSKKLDLEYFK